MAAVEKFWTRLFPEVKSHLWKNGGPVVGVQLENESRGPWPYYQALKSLAVKTGYDVPIYTRTGWPRLNGPEIQALGRFCREYGEELAAEEPVFVNKHETRRGRFVFHNDYVRRLNPDGECWIGIEKDGKIERVVDGRKICASHVEGQKSEVLSVGELKLLKPAGTPPPVEIGPAGVAVMPEESAWDSAAEYEVPFKPDANMIEIAYDGDMARLYADGQLVQDDFWKGLPIRYALRRLPKGTKRLTLKVLPWGEGAEKSFFVDGVESHPAKAAHSHTFEIGESEFLLDGKPFLVRCGEIHYARIPLHSSAG